MKIPPAVRIQVCAAALAVVLAGSHALQGQQSTTGSAGQAGGAQQSGNAAGQKPSAQRQESAKTTKTNKAETYPPELVSNGQALFGQNCGFCHGKDAGGGESGPDLTRSPLVAEDVKGNKIGDVVRNGCPDKGMPRFNLSE